MKKSILLSLFILFISLYASFDNDKNLVPFDYINILFPHSHNFDNYLIIVEKSTQQAGLYITVDSLSIKYNLINTYQVSTGREQGNKVRRGDLKTPEGLYITSIFFDEETLLNRYGSIASQYGYGAYELGYPNELDRIRRKTGSGIWIHGTDVPLTAYDSEGCIRFDNDVISYFKNDINLTNTPVIINDTIEWVEIDFLLQEIEEILLIISKWLNSWIEQDIYEYLSFYCHDDFISHRQKMDYSSWENHKKRIFNPNSLVQINLTNYEYYYANNLLLVTFIQEYKSPLVQSKGKKSIVLKKANDSWIIIQEEFYP